MEKREVRIGKLGFKYIAQTMDTCAAGFLLVVSRADKAQIAIGGKASLEELNNPRIICINCGNGKNKNQNLMNFQTYEEKEKKILSAKQALTFMLKKLSERIRKDMEPRLQKIANFIGQFEPANQYALASVYENKFHVRNMQSVFEGLCLSVKNNPIEIFFHGIEVWQKILASRQNPYSNNIFGFDLYESAKDRFIHEILELRGAVKKELTKKFLSVGYIETPMYFARAAQVIFAANCQIAIILNEYIEVSRTEKFRNFTIISTGLNLLPLLEKRILKKENWFSADNGKIVTSPRKRSKLKPQQVLDLVKSTF